MKIETIADLANRVEVAWEREECSRRGAEAQSGDAAALREALEQLSDKVCDYLQKGLIQLPLPIEGLLKQARDALAAPPRQCDVGTAEEQIKRWEEFCLEHHEYWMPSTSLTAIQRCNCPCLEGNGCNYFIWAQMPYEADESEAK
jgi:hypothetical protein